MSDGKRYFAIQWNRFKRHYDLILAMSLFTFFLSFYLGSFLFVQQGSYFHPVQLLIRVLGLSGFTLLVFILSIGPLARIFPSWRFLVYNRRHLGVTLFFIALFHAGLSFIWYQGFSEINPFVSFFMFNNNYMSIVGFPFEYLGLFALLILLLLAVTSHDFWLKILSPSVWKFLHMSVYLAYALLVGHIALGFLQSEPSIFYFIFIMGSILLLSGLHLMAFWKNPERQTFKSDTEGWIYFGPAERIPENKAIIITPNRGESIAVFRYKNQVSAISNVCAHQNGPLGEGKVIDGLVTCPWHGHQFRLEDGRAPSPFTDCVKTYQVKMIGTDLYIYEKAEKPGQYCKPVYL